MSRGRRPESAGHGPARLADAPRSSAPAPRSTPASGPVIAPTPAATQPTSSGGQPEATVTPLTRVPTTAAPATASGARSGMPLFLGTPALPAPRRTSSRVGAAVQVANPLQSTAALSSEPAGVPAAAPEASEDPILGGLPALTEEQQA